MYPYLSLSLSIYLSIYLYLSLSLTFSLLPSLTVCVYVCVCPCLSVCLSLSPPPSLSTLSPCQCVQYYTECHAIIYVVDSSDQARMDESLHILGEHSHVQYYTGTSTRSHCLKSHTYILQPLRHRIQLRLAIHVLEDALCYNM